MGGWVGGWVGVFLQYAGGVWSADVLVRLTCCVLLPSPLLLNAAAVRWVSAVSRIKLR